MRATATARLSSTLARSLLAPSPGRCSGSVVTENGNKYLPPVRYHIFKTPLPYPIGMELQNRVIENRLARREKGQSSAQDVLFLLEHTPTYTTGRRDNSQDPEKLHPEEEKVQNVGAGFYITKRGGQVTYHGPGQVVGYPLLDLNAMATPTRCYVEYLQTLLKEYAEDLGLDVTAPHADGHVGVFKGRDEKLASIGIHLQHRISSHGFAMNVTNEPLPWFDLVTACGLADVRACSISQLLARQANARAAPSVGETAEALVPRFAATFGRKFIPLSDPIQGYAEGTAAELKGLKEEVEGIQQIVSEVAHAAEKAERENDGWPMRPILRKGKFIQEDFPWE